MIELLKQVGLTQYEAEAYVTLLREGPLTGYELGKRSRVPLPRSYDVLQRLGERGLALVQPGDPPRYLAENPARFLDQLKCSMTARLEQLAAKLTTVAAPDVGEEFWVIRAGERIRERIAAMIGEAERSIGVHLPASMSREMDGPVSKARERGCRVLPAARTVPLAADAVLVLVDDREVLVGTVQSDRSQAVITRNRALVGVAGACFAADLSLQQGIGSRLTTQAASDGLAWEDDKQRRLRLLIGGSNVA